MVVSGPTRHARGYLEGLDVLGSMRLCANMPAQHAVQAALEGHQSITGLLMPGGRLREQRDRTWQLLNDIPGVSCVKPRGALYCFPRLDPAVHFVEDDQQLVLDLLLQERILLVQGTGINWPRPDHLRIVTLPHVDDLTTAVGRIRALLHRRRIRA